MTFKSMTKRILSLLTAGLFLCLVLTSCVKSSMQMSVDFTGNVSISGTYMYQDSMIELMEENPFLKVRERLEKSGFTVEDCKEGEFSGFRASLEKVHIDRLSGFEGEQEPLDLFQFMTREDEMEPVFFTVKKGFLKSTYTASMCYDLSGDVTDEDIEQMMPYMDDSFEITFQVTLPKNAISHNADSVSEDGRTYLWNVALGKRTDVQFTFELWDLKKLLIMAAVVLVIVIIILLILILVVITKNRREREAAERRRLEMREAAGSDGEPEEDVAEDDITAGPEELTEESEAEELEEDTEDDLPEDE